MARMMDRMMVDSLQPFGFARMTSRRGTGSGAQSGNGGSDQGAPRDGLRTERSDIRRDRARNLVQANPGTHAGNGTRHPPTQGFVN